MAKKQLFCSNCHENKNEEDFTNFSRNPSLRDRNGRVIFCRDCCNKMVEENGNTIEALKNLLRILDIPFIESMANLAVEMLNKKREDTNEVIKKNVYDGTIENVGIESSTIQTTLYTCYAGRIGLIPKKYINFSFSDGIREDDGSDNKEPIEEDKERDSSIKFLKKMFSEAMYNDSQRLAKAVQLKMDELSLHKNNSNARQSKFKLKNAINYLVDIGELDKAYYGFMIGDADEDIGDECNKVTENKEEEVVAFKVTPNLNLDMLADKWGYGYTPEHLHAFEKKYQMLKNNYPEKTALHTEALLTYIRYRVNEEIATAKGDVKSAKDWGELASKQATNAKINVAQLSKSDLSDGLDSFSTLVKAIETSVDAISILPRFKEKPQDRVDFTLWCYINYVRDLKGLPPAEYDEIYRFYQERKKEYEQRATSLQDSNDENNTGVEDEVGDGDGEY
jgi:hypothetical protein